MNTHLSVVINGKIVDTFDIFTEKSWCSKDYYENYKNELDKKYNIEIDNDNNKEYLMRDRQKRVDFVAFLK